MLPKQLSFRMLLALCIVLYLIITNKKSIIQSQIAFNSLTSTLYTLQYSRWHFAPFKLVYESASYHREGKGEQEAGCQAHGV